MQVLNVFKTGVVSVTFVVISFQVINYIFVHNVLKFRFNLCHISRKPRIRFLCIFSNYCTINRYRNGHTCKVDVQI